MTPNATRAKAVTGDANTPQLTGEQALCLVCGRIFPSSFALFAHRPLEPSPRCLTAEARSLFRRKPPRH